MTLYCIDGLDYHVVEAGAGEPLVLLHGFTGSVENWRPHLPALATYYRVIAVDLPGHGRSAAPKDPSCYSMTATAADLEQLMTRLDAAPAHWLGYSMGGRLALYLAVHHPALVRSLILESASPGLATAEQQAARRAQDETLAGRIEVEGIEQFVNHWEQIPLFDSQKVLSAETHARLREQRLNNSVQGLTGSLRGMGTGAQPSLWEKLARLDQPTLLLTGELDAKFVAINRQMAAALPAAELQIMPDAGHAIHLERPKYFVELVLGFLKAVRERPRGVVQS